MLLISKFWGKRTQFLFRISRAVCGLGDRNKMESIACTGGDGEGGDRNQTGATMTFTPYIFHKAVSNEKSPHAGRAPTVSVVKFAATHPDICQPCMFYGVTGIANIDFITTKPQKQHPKIQTEQWIKKSCA